MTNTLGDALPKEMARVRDEIMPMYVEIGQSGALALSFIRRDLDIAAKAMADGDVVAMMRSYLTLKGIKG